MIGLITCRMYVKNIGKLVLIILAFLCASRLILEAKHQLTVQSGDPLVFENPGVITIPRLTEVIPIKLSTRPLNPNIGNITRGPILNCAKDEIQSGYCVVSNVVRAAKTVGYNDSVTLTTQGTTGFLDHIREVCKRWQGPISLAVYAPGSDFELAGSHVRYLKNCGQDKCVSDWVTWHVIYDINHQPNATGDDWLARNCREPIVSPDSYVKRLNLTYPINVARNVARLNAKTKYVFPSDIELYPSLNIIPEFLKLVRRRKIFKPNEGGRTKREVYVLPVFEVNSTIKSPPTSKHQLFDLYKSGMAVSFHQYVCNICHKIPDLGKWLYSKIDSAKDLDIFKTVKRNRAFKLYWWEPFFIGTNDFPLFDEKLSWNGQSNKMQVVLEMCFLDYDFHILDRAFLIHAPGIKIYNATKEAYRKPYILQNSKTYSEIQKRLKTMYRNQPNKRCT